MAEVFVELDGSGRLVVRKVATAPRDDPAAEAAWLEQAAGPGVAVLVAVDPAGRWLATAHAGAHTWRTAGPAPGDAARLAAGVLRTLARLHQRGLVHGAVSADHVIIGPDGPVLCSPSGGAPDPEVDRAAVVALLGSTLDRWAHDGVSVPGRPTWSRALDLLRRPTSGWTLDGVADVLDPPVDRPVPFSGRRRRSALVPGRRTRTAGPTGSAGTAGPAGSAGTAGTAGSAGTPEGGEGGPIVDRPPRRRPAVEPPRRARWVAVGLGLAAAVALAGAAMAVQLGAGGSGPVAADRLRAEPLAGDVPGTSPAGGPLGLPSAGEALEASPLPHPLGTGGPAPEDGGSLYRSDRPGDVTATAASPCPGTPTAAVLEPATGTVWVYPSLPTPEERVAGVAVQRTPGAAGLDVRTDGDCDRIVVVGPAGEAAVPAG